MDKLDVDEEIADILIDEGSRRSTRSPTCRAELLEIESFDADTVENCARAPQRAADRGDRPEENIEQADPSLLELEGMDRELAARL